MIKPTFKNHVKEFDDYLMALKKQMGPFVTWEKLIKNEAAAILASAAKKTKKGKAGLIRKKYTIKQRGKKNMPEGAKQKKDKKGKFKKTGRTKGSKTPQNDELIPFVKMNGRDYYTRNYYPEPVWEKLKTEVKKQREKKLARIWSGKATWLLVAIKAGVRTTKFEGQASMRKAISAQGGSYASNEVENGKPIKKVFKYSIEVFNGAHCAINKNARGSWALRSAMAGREGYFKRNLKHGVFNKAKQMMAKYPGIALKNE
tara:strand:- start:1352 stop:2125 length:774 start_codon:yes stop_codon:yes gene_type:complete